MEPDNFGNCECRYAETLKRIIYNRNRNYLSYGIKFIPNHEGLALTLTATAQRSVRSLRRLVRFWVVDAGRIVVRG